MAYFKRYAPPTRRAIYYAREAALHSSAMEIDSSHFVYSLLTEKNTRVDTLFHLDEKFPEDTTRMRGLKAFVKPHSLPLSKNAKQVVLHAVNIADQLDEFWVDTDHLLLAILALPTCKGAVMLNKAGFHTGAVHDVVKKNRHSRDDYGTRPVLWWLERPVSKIGGIAGYFYIFVVYLLFRIFSETSCGTPFHHAK